MSNVISEIDALADLHGLPRQSDWQKKVDALTEQHRRDSAKLRRTCQQRDAYKAEAEALRIELDNIKNKKDG